MTPARSALRLARSMAEATVDTGHRKPLRRIVNRVVTGTRAGSEDLAADATKGDSCSTTGCGPPMSHGINPSFSSGSPYNGLETGNVGPRLSWESRFLVDGGTHVHFVYDCVH
ncbi:hypothetical protein I545_6974 [Mycobacterium kansasii 662]|uniref:Uncharacterized protein n=1 Tax=Mycobacterium kansasii 662 TaxID=1299326 RepID=X7XPG5_MYCKA|nr:hypothetical protein I545_6974 [Mycobacterium kansasii 662]